MKRIHLSLVLVALFCVAAFGSAAFAGPVGTMEVNAGYAKSSTDVTGNDESFGGGIAFGAAYWRSASPTVMWGAEVSYDNLGSVDYDNGVTTDNSVSGSVFRINPAIRANFGSMVGPNFFAQGGAGYYNVSANIEDSVAGNLDESEGKFGYNLGAGVGFPVGPKTRMNVMGQWHSVATEGESTNYLEFKAGVGFGL
jgi:hypothetical protein